MKIYFDESGNTGCLTREGHETYCGKDGQSLYALGAVLSPESEDGALAASYEAFKERCGAAGREVKGSDLLTRKCNDQLSDFFETFLVCGRFKLCLYSKDFYLATALMQTILGPDAKVTFPQAYYSEASNLALFGSESLKAYAEFSAMPDASGARLLTERLLVNSDGVQRGASCMQGFAASWRQGGTICFSEPASRQVTMKSLLIKTLST